MIWKISIYHQQTLFFYIYLRAQTQNDADDQGDKEEVDALNPRDIRCTPQITFGSKTSHKYLPTIQPLNAAV